MLCGEVVCLVRKNDCCKNLPGIRIIPRIGKYGVTSQEYHEGELSYHARVVEGGTSIFIVPSTAEMYLIDAGRIQKYLSLYRNNLGEVYSIGALGYNKWDKFFLSEETGGLQSLNLLKKAYLNNKLSNMILQDR
jgi:hypothetical protein